MGRARFDQPRDRFEIVCVIAGSGKITSPSGEESRLGPGDSCMVPASWDGYEVLPEEPMKWVRSWVV